MVYLMDHHWFKPKYYSPKDPMNLIFILPHHVCCLCGIKIANMNFGNTSILQMYSTTEYFDAVGLVKGIMSQDPRQGIGFLLYGQEGRSEGQGSSTPEEIWSA